MCLPDVNCITNQPNSQSFNAAAAIVVDEDEYAIACLLGGMLTNIGTASDSSDLFNVIPLTVSVSTRRHQPGLGAVVRYLLSRYHTGFFRRELLSFEYVTHDPLIR